MLNKVSKILNYDKYMDILGFYISSMFQDFENFLRTEIILVENDIRLVLDENSSSFITCELESGIYTFKNLSEALFIILQLEYEVFNNSNDIQLDNFTMKTKLVVRPGNIAIMFDEKSFFSAILGFTPHWDYKHYNEYISQKITNLSTINKLPLKCGVIDGSVVNGFRQPILYSFVLKKPPGFKVFNKLETIRLKK